MREAIRYLISRWFIWGIGIVLIVVLSLSIMITRQANLSLDEVTNNIVDDASELVLIHVEDYVEPLSLFDTLMMELWDPTMEFEEQSIALESLARQIVKHYPQIASVQIGDEFGDFVMYRQFENGGTHTKFVKANAAEPQTIWRYFDGDELDYITSEPGTDYDPRVRPWYIGAKANKSLYFTEPYVFFTEQVLGITAASPIYVDDEFWGVYSFDIRLQDMVDFLDSLDLTANGEAFIVTENRDIISSTAIPYFELDPVTNTRKMQSEYWNSIENGVIDVLHHVEVDGEDHLVMYRKVSTGFNKNWLVGVIINTSNFNSKFKINIQFTGIISILILILSAMMFYYKFKENKVRTELINMAKYDQLTTLMNRHSFEEVFKLLVENFRSREQPFSIILGDVDYFKKINDNFGHSVGDEILSELSNQIKLNLRKSDYACRWGGEEFLIVLSNTDHEYACIVADKLRKEIEEFQFKTSVGVIHNTISFGVATYDREYTMLELINIADEKLFQAKDEGRNRIKC